MAEGEALLRRHVQLFNEGVRSGDFAPMLRLSIAGDRITTLVVTFAE